jgi:hypothetical protein
MERDWFPATKTISSANANAVEEQHGFDIKVS